MSPGRRRGEPEAEADALPEAGWVAPELADELPGLALRYDELRFRLLLGTESLRKRPTAPHRLAETLADMADAFGGRAAGTATA